MRTFSIALLGLLAASSSLAAPTFSKDVAPILYKNCVACHRPGEMAPMSLLDYKSARPWARAMQAAVVSRKMPPWFADPRHGHFQNDARLKDSDIETIRAWVAGGAPEGDPKDLPAQPKFIEGWALGQPDMIIDIGEDFTVPAGRDVYKDFVVDSKLAEGKWVRAAQVLPGNRKAVHHVHFTVIGGDAEPGEVSLNRRQGVGKRALEASHFETENGLSRVKDSAPVVDNACAGDGGIGNLSGFDEGSFATMLPGKGPDVFDVFGDGSVAKYVSAGSKMKFQIHYANNKEAMTDRTRVGLYFAPRAPERPLKRVDMRNRYFLIPAGAANHEVKRCYELESDKLLLAITPHAHYRGKDALYELVHADGRRDILLSVPNYDFNWQLQYRLKDPVLMEKGSHIEATFHFDNSANNRANPDSTKAIRWGDRSEDEMMVTWTETLDAKPATPVVGN